jgi:cyclophilin family peptidyl-prolyl cis-trans isomerase
MWDRIRGSHSESKRHLGGMIAKPGRRAILRPLVEGLEDRQLLTSATLQPLSNLTVPAQQGYTLPLLANTGATDAQTYTVTSSNPNVTASIATGPFWNVGVSYTDPANASNDFNGNLTFQLFQGLTPNTVSEISNLTNNGYFVNSGKYFNRILAGFVVQGGSPTVNGLEPNPPVTFANENVQQLAFTGVDQLAMANAGRDTNTSQFFITLANQNSSLGYGFTIFGQLLTGVDTLNQMAALPVMANTAPITPPNQPEVSQPDNPLTISSASLSSTNPNGTLISDTTQATQNQTSVITVTATDPANGSKTSQSFVVTVSAYGGPTTPPTPGVTPTQQQLPLNLRPYAHDSAPNVAKNTPTQVQLNGVNNNPTSSTSTSTLTYSLLTQPDHGTVTNFNPSTGTLTYTPDTGFVGTDTLTYQTSATALAETTPATSVSNPGTVTFAVGGENTGTVNVVGNVLTVTPVPRRDLGTNTIDVSQVPNSSSPTGLGYVVTVDGIPDTTAVSTAGINKISVFGGKRARNKIVIDPSVTVPSVINGGLGYKNKLTGGSVETREHGWFGHSTLVGGSGPNQLIGRAGLVRFKPTKSTNLIFAGVPKKRTSHLNATPPGGTFFKLVRGRLVPVFKF